MHGGKVICPLQGISTETGQSAFGCNNQSCPGIGWKTFSGVLINLVNFLKWISVNFDPKMLNNGELPDIIAFKVIYKLNELESSNMRQYVGV